MVYSGWLSSARLTESFHAFLLQTIVTEVSPGQLEDSTIPCSGQLFIQGQGPGNLSIDRFLCLVVSGVMPFHNVRHETMQITCTVDGTFKSNYLLTYLLVDSPSLIIKLPLVLLINWRHNCEDYTYFATELQFFSNPGRAPHKWRHNDFKK